MASTENCAQDMLRGHYQQLSADPNSLANLDQGMSLGLLIYRALLTRCGLLLDLPNNLQREVPIVCFHFRGSEATVTDMHPVVLSPRRLALGE